VGLLLVATLLGSQRGEAFVHVVRQGGTVARIAERVYGRVELERVIVAANGLDRHAGTALVPGMRLEVPAVGYHRVQPGERWTALAASLLGAAHRGDVLARLNGSHPWLRPTIGQELIVPYNLRFVARQGDTTQAVAYRFLGRRDEAWVVASYNRLQRARLRQGEVILVPLTDLPLSEQGKREAEAAGARACTQAQGQARQAQRAAAEELPKLLGDVRRGRYVEAVRRGNLLLGRQGLTLPQKAAVHRQLTEAYVALGAVGLAASACRSWRAADPHAALDPVELSPKILAACVEQTEAPPPHGSATSGHRRGGRPR